MYKIAHGLLELPLEATLAQTPEIHPSLAACVLRSQNDSHLLFLANFLQNTFHTATTPSVCCLVVAVVGGVIVV